MPRLRLAVFVLAWIFAGFDGEKTRMPAVLRLLAFLRLRHGCPASSAYLEDLIDKAKEISQRTLFGIGFARILNKI